MSFLIYIVLFLSSWLIACIACMVKTSPKQLRNKNTEAALFDNQVLQYKTDNDLDFRVVESGWGNAAVIRNEDYLDFDEVVLIK